MIILATLIFILPQKFGDTICVRDLQILAGIESNPYERIVETYKILASQMTLDELRQLAVNPLLVPKPSNITAFSGYMRPFSQLLELIKDKSLIDELLSKLKFLVSLEIAKKLEAVSEQTSINQILRSPHAFDTLAAHDSGIGNILLSPDGKILYSRSLSDWDIKFWNAETGKQLLNSEQKPIVIHHEPPATDIALSNDGKYLFTATHHHIYRWDAKTGAAVSDFEIPKNFEDSGSTYIHAIALDPAEDSIYVAYGKRVILFDIKTGEANHIVETHLTEVVKLFLEPQSGILYSASGGNNREMRLWNLRTRSQILNADGDPKIYYYAFNLYALASNKDGGKLYIPGYQSIVARNLSTDKHEMLTSGSISEITGLLLGKSGKILISANEIGEIRFWNTRDNSLLKNPDQTPLSLSIRTRINTLAQSPDGLILYAGDRDGNLHSFHLPHHLPLEFLE